MGLESGGGYAEKLGNRFEGLWVASQLLLLLEETVRAVTVEAVGDDEAGVDLWIDRPDESRDAQQCKAGNGSKSKWTMADLHRRGILEYSMAQLTRDPRHRFTLVSPLPAVHLNDLSRSARDSDNNPEHFRRFQVEAISAEHRRSFDSFCRYLKLNPTDERDLGVAVDVLRRMHVHHFADDDQTRESLRAMAQRSVAANPDIVIAALTDFADRNLRRRITSPELVQHLRTIGLQVQRLALDSRVSLALEGLREAFQDSIGRPVTGRIIPRNEVEKLLGLFDSTLPPAVIVLHGDPGVGKSGVLQQFLSSLNERNTPALGLRLDRIELHGNSVEFGKLLGLPASPVACLAELSGESRSVLILDQLDALRWTSPAATRGMELCKALMREVLGNRRLGRPMTLVLSCRTFDMRHDPQISDWISMPRLSEDGKFEQVEVKSLPEDVVRDVVRSMGIDPDRMTDRSLSLLTTIQTLAIWTRLMQEGAKSPDFVSLTALMREFWMTLRQRIEEKAITPEERDSVIGSLVEYMEVRASQSAPRWMIDRHRRLATELQTLGILNLTSAVATFSHQSHFDFLIAEGAARNLDLGKESIIGWLGDSGRQTLERREQLRQLLFLVSDERPVDFAQAVQQLISSAQVRFHLKQLVIEVLGQLTPSDRPMALIVELLGSEEWRDHVLRHGLVNNQAWIRAISAEGLLERWLSSGDVRLENSAIWLLESVIQSESALVAGLLEPLIDSGTNWPERIQSALLRSDPATEAEELFELRIRCIRCGSRPHYIAWNDVAMKSPLRAIRLIAAELSTPRTESDRDRGQLDRRADVRPMKAAARRLPNQTWALLFPILRRRVERRIEKCGDADLVTPPSASDNLRQRIRVSRILVDLLQSAAQAMAVRSPHLFMKKVMTHAGFPGTSLRRIFLVGFTQLPVAFADDALKWLIADDRRLRCGRGYKYPKWMLARRLIERMSPTCSETTFRSVESHLLSYRDPEEKEMASWWLHATKRGIFENRFLAGQYHLLPGLCPEKRSKETTARIGVLERRYEIVGKDFFTRTLPRGGWVHSPLARDHLDRLSDGAWLKLMANRGLPQSDRGWQSARFLANSVQESSVEMFCRDVRTAALRQPKRFAKLALRISDDAPPDYMAEILGAMALIDPPADIPEHYRIEWEPAAVDDIAAVIERVEKQFPSNHHFNKQYARLIDQRRDVPTSETLIRRLIAMAGHADPAPDELFSQGHEGIADCTVHDLEVNAINCVRGVAARSLASVLFRDRSPLPLLRDTIEMLLDDRNPCVRVAAVRLVVAVWNVDRDLSVDWLVRASKTDTRVGACGDAHRIYNVAFPSFTDQLAPLIHSLADSKYADVSEAGAMQVALKWIHFGIFEQLIERCAGGAVAQRKGVAHVAATMSMRPNADARWSDLARRFMYDADKDVRNELVRIFGRDFSVERFERHDFLRDYCRSPAFRDDPNRFLFALDRQKGPVLPFADFILDCTAEFATAFAQTSPASGQLAWTIGDKLVPLLLRLYEEARTPERAAIRSRCLDMWDSLLKSGLGSVSALTRDLGHS